MSINLIEFNISEIFSMPGDSDLIGWKFFYSIIEAFIRESLNILVFGWILIVER